MPLDKTLIVEDDPATRTLLQSFLKRHRGVSVCCAATLAEAVTLVAKERFDLVLLGISRVDGDVLRVIAQMAAMPEKPVIVMISAAASTEAAIACVRAGAFDYTGRPFQPGQIEAVLARVHERLQQQEIAGDDQPAESLLVGSSPAMQRLRQLIQRVAVTDATLLITGESGTGKEMIAREFFRASRRANQPFVRVNCAAISPTLIESEFFGHEKGAFTGATERREGRFELAHQGTLLLDEVSEIPPALQAKLLRVLQEREFERVGGNKTIKVNVRIVATSNRDLLAHVGSGQFRQDLYYRLNVFPVYIPPLRDRPEDIPTLADHFLKRFARQHGIAPCGFSSRARAALVAHRWPGNVRELQNAIERAVILSENGAEISEAALGLDGEVPLAAPGREPIVSWPRPGRAATEPEPFGAATSAASRRGGSAAGESLCTTDETGRPLTLVEVEKHVIRDALRRHAGNRTHAAGTLGISIRTLRNKLAEYRAAGAPLDDEGMEPESTAA